MRRTRKTVLTKVLALLRTPEQWTQGTPARDADGNPVLCNSRDAKSFCLVGALYRAADGQYAGAHDGARTLLTKAIIAIDRTWSIVTFNDDPTTRHADVLRVLRRAIRMAA